MKIKNNKRIFTILIVIIIILVITYIVVNKLYESNQNNILTKNFIFDIIDNVDDIIINCISTDGEKYLSEENKLDSTVLYIVKNNEKFNNYIILSDESENTCVGKINFQKFIETSNQIFELNENDCTNYKYYDDGYINLNIEPSNYVLFDEKELVSIKEEEKLYNVIIKYKRCLNDVQNNVNIEYKLGKDFKIQEVNILSSTMI
jgi:hypothetical protein